MHLFKLKTFERTSLFVKGFAYTVRCFSDRHGLFLLYLIALGNDRHLFIKETMDYEWAESRAGLNFNSSKITDKNSEILGNTYTCRHTVAILSLSFI